MAAGLALASLLLAGTILMHPRQDVTIAGQSQPLVTVACFHGDCSFSPQRTTLESPPPAAGVKTACPYCGADPSSWRAQTNVAPPAIGGKAAALIEGSCGSLIYGLNEHERLPPASLTKIVTAMVTRERARLEDRVAIEINGWDLAAEDGSSIMGLEAGMELSVQELLYGLLLPSGNDAALALAAHAGGLESFVDGMNAVAGDLGLENTHFVNPDGRDAAEHYSSAFDMAILGRRMMQDPVLRGIAGTLSFVPQWTGGVLWNANYLLQDYAGAEGVKTGYTEGAEFTFVGSARRDGRELFVAVLGSWNLYGDAERLMDWAFANTRPACSANG